MKTIKTISFLTFAVIAIGCQQPVRNEQVVHRRSAILDSIPDSITAIPANAIPDLNSVVKAITENMRVESEFIGEGGAPSEQWKRYLLLKKIASTDYLIAYTDFNSAVLRCYAFQALAERRSEKVFPVLLEHLDDTAWVVTQSGCLRITMFVRDYFIAVVTPDHIEADVYKLTEGQQLIVDSLLIKSR